MYVAGKVVAAIMVDTAGKDVAVIKVYAAGNKGGCSRKGGCSEKGCQACSPLKISARLATRGPSNRPLCRSTRTKINSENLGF